jgi:hypothetical protein
MRTNVLFLMLLGLSLPGQAADDPQADRGPFRPVVAIAKLVSPPASLVASPPFPEGTVRSSAETKKATEDLFRQLNKDKVVFAQRVAAIEELRGRCQIEPMEGFSEESWLQGVDFSETSVRDADLYLLDGFGSLKKLNLTGTQVTDAGMSHLGDLLFLQELSLCRT